MQKIKELNEELILNSRMGLKEIPFSKISVKLRAIVALGDNNISKVSEVFGVTRNTLKSWVKNFSRHGINGLKAQPRRARATKLSDIQRQELLGLLKNHKANWTLLKLQNKILKEYGVKISQMSIWRILKSSGLSYITPRPSHYKKDEKAGLEFKKKSIRNYKK